MPNTIQQFHQELASLRDNVEEFSYAYPEVASELRLSAGRSSDPHVEQLLQSFAWLTAQLRHDMQQQKYETPNHLLNSLYPHLIRSIPSMMVLQANVLPDGANFVNGYQLDRGRLFKTRTKARRNASGKEQPAVTCQIQCRYNTPLWPLGIDDISVKSKNIFSFLDHQTHIKTVVSVSIRNEGSEPISDYPISKLRFFIADPELRIKLYQMLSNNLCRCVIKTSEGVTDLDNATIKWLGFDREESVLLQPEGLHDAYRMMQEYFNFPEKFYFFEVANIDLSKATDYFELLFLFDVSETLNALDRASLKLNCFPAINLFPTTFNPIQLDHSHYEYRLLADERQYGQSEVHSVNNVKLIDNNGHTQTIPPWLGELSSATTDTSSLNNSHYLTRLAAPLSATAQGCDTMLSLYDNQLSPQTMIDKSLSVKGFSSNRNLAESLRISNRVSLMGSGALLDATVVSRPTLFKDAKLQGPSILKLLSQLHLNYVTLLSADPQNATESLKRFKQLLKIYSDPNAPAQQRQIEGIVSIALSRAVKRMGKDAWRGHYHGSQLTLTIDESFFEGVNSHLLGEVLSRFFALNTTLNHFVQLQLASYQREGIIKQWHPRIGEQVIL